MKQIEETLIAAFPEYDVLLEQRPDGSLLFTLQQDEHPVMRRALSPTQMQNSLQLDWLIGAIQRDLAIEAGKAPMVARLQSQSRLRLPTYAVH
ncbi:DUF3509 domain-containing protein [Azotobacter salinestris]|uniref:DUF3509 domain-containing protein n=1 Tax=Azotobacter salinestris TaxID=69964 RepID=UPI001266AEA4|nr:DUF3509 domain-containing protein [Azotobacter salinestris]